jgi:WD40 repeat protein/mono/diheme cytochrome c family protein
VKFFVFRWSNVAMIMIVLSPIMSVAQPGETNEVTFDQVQPVFKKHCVGCHGVERERGDLNLTSIEGVKAGSSSGPVAVAGKPDESLLYSLPAHLETPRMPPGKAKIPQRELDLIRGWIEGGMLVRRTKSVAGDISPNPRQSRLPTSTANAKSRHDQLPNPDATVTPLSRKTAITALAVSPRNGQVAVSGHRQVLLFKGSGEQPDVAFAFPEGEVFALRFSRDGEWLLAGGGIGGESGKVVAFDVASGRRLFEVGDESDVVLTLDISPDRNLVALGGPGRLVKIYRTSDGELVATLRKHTDWILSVAFSPDGLMLASSDRFGGLEVWEARTGKSFHSLRGHTGAVNSIAWSSDSERLVSGGQDSFLRIWDMHYGTLLNHWNSQVGGVLTTSWAESGLIIAGGRNKQVAVYDSVSQLQREWRLADEVVELAIFKDGLRAITGDAAGNVSSWEVNSGKSAGDYVLPIASVAAKAEVPPPSRKPRSTTSITSTVASDVEHELIDARKALASTEAAIKATEDSLNKLKSTADTLRRMISAREQSAHTGRMKHPADDRDAKANSK